VRSSEIDAEYLELLADSDKNTYIPTDFMFLKEHNSWRPECLHLLMGTASSGKSTLTKDLVAEASKSSRVIVYKSEETTTEFAKDLHNGAYGDIMKEDIHIFSEMENENFDTVRAFARWLEKKVVEIQPGVVFFDNLTTSRYYAEKRPNEQLAFVSWLKKMAHEYMIPIVLVAHTRKEVTDNMNRLIVKEDIRGTSNVTNLVQFFYVLQKIMTGNTWNLFLRIDKNRGYRVKRTLFLMDYRIDRNRYISSLPVEFEEFKEIYQQRNRL